MEARLSTFATLTLRALLPLGEPSPRNPPTSDVPCRLQAPPPGTIRGELVVRAVRTIAPDYADGLATADSIDRTLASPLDAPAPAPFDVVSGDNLHGQSRSFTTPVKG